MQSDESLIEWVEKVRTGDEQAAQAIWAQFFPQLLIIARRGLPAGAGAIDDEEDVALSVLESFFTAAQKGRFPDLQDAGSLWRLLSEMTRRKVVDRLRRHLALKEGGGQLRGDSAFVRTDSNGQIDFADASLLPAEVEVIVRERIRVLLNAVRETDPRLEALVLAKMEGYTNEELAKRFERSVPTIERWLARIRKIGERVLDE